MIVAGEASGDTLGASLIHALRRAAPHADYDFFGGAGPKMRDAGARPVVNVDDLAITGLAGVAAALPQFWKTYKALERAASERRPRAVILIDWPDFNLRLARRLRSRGVKVIYYVSPQLWAWRPHRVRAVRRDVDLLLSILPFEKEWYAARGFARVEYVGHPLVGAVAPRATRIEFRRAREFDERRPLVALLPGSRRREIARNLPPMIEAAARLADESTQFVVALTAHARREEVAPMLESSDARRLLAQGDLRVVYGETREALGAADAAAVASGTATLEAGLIGTPLVVVYRESSLNWHTLGRLITTDHFGLINLIAGERLAAELMQSDFTPDRLAKELRALLDPHVNREVRERLRAAIEKLGEAGASERAAEAVLREIGGG